MGKTNQKVYSPSCNLDDFMGFDSCHTCFWSGTFWGENNLINLSVILLNIGVGIGMINANIKHLNTLDEMMKKVQLEAMGISLGAAVVGGIAYSMLDATNVIPFDAEIGFLVMLIGISYMISLAINLRRYK